MIITIFSLYQNQGLIHLQNFRVKTFSRKHLFEHVHLFIRGKRMKHMWLEGCLNPYEMEQSWECTFLRHLVTTSFKSKLSIKKDFIIELQRYQLACTSNTALMSQIGHACQLVVLKSNDEIFFEAHLLFIWVKSFKKVHFQLCFIL